MSGWFRQSGERIEGLVDESVGLTGRLGAEAAGSAPDACVGTLPCRTNRTLTACEAMADAVVSASPCIRPSSHATAKAVGADTVKVSSARCSPLVPASHVSNVALGVCNCSRPRTASHRRRAELSVKSGNPSRGWVLKPADGLRNSGEEWGADRYVGSKYHAAGLSPLCENPWDSRRNRTCKKVGERATA